MPKPKFDVLTKRMPRVRILRGWSLDHKFMFGIIWSAGGPRNNMEIFNKKHRAFTRLVASIERRVVDEKDEQLLLGMIDLFYKTYNDDSMYECLLKKFYTYHGRI